MSASHEWTERLFATYDPYGEDETAPEMVTITLSSSPVVIQVVPDEVDAVVTVAALGDVPERIVASVKAVLSTAGRTHATHTGGRMVALHVDAPADVGTVGDLLDALLEALGVEPSAATFELE